MNPLFLLFGLLGAAFAVGGQGSDSSGTSTVNATTAPDNADAENDDGMDSPLDDGMDSQPNGGMDMSGGHQGHDMDGPVDDGMDMPDGQHDHDMGGGMSSSEDGYVDITTFGMFHGSSSHTMGHSLDGGRTPITTEALEAYNGLRAFLGLEPVDLETIGKWAFENDLTNNDQAYGEDLSGVGLFYGMQGAKAGWISDEAFDPQLLADVQRLARQDEVDQVMDLVDTYGYAGFATFLEDSGLTETFINTMKMEPHYGGWMHGRTHGDLGFSDETGAQVATAHDLNHLTVLSHDQTQPFMNDTFDWPQWPALDTPEGDVIDYFQSMVTLGDPRGEGVEFATLSEMPQASPGEQLMQMIVSEVSPDLPASQPMQAQEDEVLSLF